MSRGDPKDRVPPELQEWTGWRSWEADLDDDDLEDLAWRRFSALDSGDPYAIKAYVDGREAMTGGGSGDELGWDIEADLRDCETEAARLQVLLMWEFDCY